MYLERLKETKTKKKEFNVIQAQTHSLLEFSQRTCHRNPECLLFYILIGIHSPHPVMSVYIVLEV